MEVLKSAELQNFFKDECVTYQEEDTAFLDRTPPHTAVLYPITLEDRLILLLSLPDTMIHFNVPVESRGRRQDNCGEVCRPEAATAFSKMPKPCTTG